MPTVPPPLPDQHRFLVIDERLTDASTLSPVEVVDARQAAAAGRAYCPTCRGPVRVVITETGPAVEHVGENPFADHEPEDPVTRRIKHLVASQLRTLFPSGNVQLDAQVPELGYLPDIAMVNPRGGKMVVEVQAQELTYDEVAQRCEQYESNGIRCLWVLDHRRLKLTKKQGLIRKATLAPLETALLATNEPLLFLDPARHQLTWVHAMPQVRELAQLGEKKIGQVECLLRRYRLGSLRIRDGRWWVDTHLDPAAPAPPPLPARLQKKLDKHHAAPQL